MSEKNVLYYFQVCGLSFEQIADKTKLSVDVIREIVSKPKAYPLAYVPRNRYNNWVNGK
jgi:hypothetical protein